MRLFETTLILLSVASCLLALFGRSAFRYVAWLALLSLLIHILFEGIRWQLSLVYMVAVIAAIFFWYKGKVKKWLKVFANLVGILFCLISWSLAFYLPVFDLPTPSGPYYVGSSMMHLTDSTRPEEITPRMGDVRETMVKVWYPSTQKGKYSDPYLLPVERVGLAAKYGLPATLLSHLDYVETHTYRDVSVASGTFPVIIFSPGFYTPANSYYSLIEDWVSHGFMVFSINHSYQTVGTEFPDGRRVFFDLGYSQKTAWSDEMGEAYSRFQEAGNEEERRQAVNDMNKAYPFTQNVTRWSRDVRLVVDKLVEKSQKEGALITSADLDQIVVTGHSLGGAAALEALIGEGRIRAGVNMDGTQWGSVIGHSFAKPVLYIKGDWLPSFEDVNRYIFNDQHSNTFYQVRLHQSGHSNFSDIPFLVRLKAMNQAGSIGPRQAIESLNKLVMSFCREALSGNSDFSKTTSLVKEDPWLEMKEEE